MKPGRLLECGILALAAVLAHLPARTAPPSYDDVAGIEVNPRIRDWGRLGRYVLDPRDSYSYYPWRPVTEATFALQVQGFGAGIPGLRAGNLALHVLASWLVLSVARTLLPGLPWAALLAAGFFAVHPLAGLCVDYVYQRSVALVGLFGLLCVRAYLDRRMLLAWTAALLAMGCKENAVTLPLWLGVLEAVDRSPGGWRRWWPFVLPPAVAAAQVARALASGLGGNPTLVLGPWGYLLAQGEAFLHYARMHALPPHPHFLHDDAGPGGAWALLPLAGVLGWVVLGPARHRGARLGAGLLLAPHALESSAFPMQNPVFDYRCYPGLLGAGILFGLLAERVRRGRTLAASALLVLGIHTAGSARAWTDPAAIFSWDFRETSRLYFTHNVRGWELLSKGRLPQAEREFRRTLALSDWRQARQGLALALALQGKEGPGLERGLREHPTLHPAWTLFLNRFLSDLGRADLAELVMRQSLEAYPDLPELWENLGVALGRQGRPADAESALRRALALREGFPEAWSDLGVLLASEGRLGEAEAAYRRALALRPRYAMAWLNLALLLEATGREDEAAEARRRWAACPEDPRLPPPVR